jgi:hypothetical protein
MGKIVEQTKEIKLRRIPRLVREGSPHRTGKKPTKPAPEKTFEQMIKSLVTDWQLPPDVDAALEKFMDLADEYSGGEDNAKNIKAFNKAMVNVQSATKLRIQDKLVDLKILDIPARSMAQQQIDRDAPFGPGREKPTDPTARNNSATPKPKAKAQESVGKQATGSLFEPNNEYGNDVFQESFRDKTSGSPFSSSGGDGHDPDYDDGNIEPKSSIYRNMLNGNDGSAVIIMQELWDELIHSGRYSEERVFDKDKGANIKDLVGQLDLDGFHDPSDVEDFLQDVRDYGWRAPSL